MGLLLDLHLTEALLGDGKGLFLQKAFVKTNGLFTTLTRVKAKYLFALRLENVNYVGSMGSTQWSIESPSSVQSTRKAQTLSLGSCSIRPFANVK